MKLLSRDSSKITISLDAGERQLFVELLELYPLLDEAYDLGGPGVPSKKQGKSNALLREALAQQRQELKEHVKQFLADGAKVRASETGCTVQLSREDSEFLLQVFNDIRLGAWVKLGSPDPLERMRERVNGETARFYWIFELSNLYESMLLMVWEEE